jgi:amino acid transporter
MFGFTTENDTVPSGPTPASRTLANLVSRGVTAKSSDYFAIGGGLMNAIIVGLATLVGFDSAANLAEEANDPFRNVPHVPPRGARDRARRRRPFKH